MNGLPKKDLELAKTRLRLGFMETDGVDEEK